MAWRLPFFFLLSFMSLQCFSCIARRWYHHFSWLLGASLLITSSNNGLGADSRWRGGVIAGNKRWCRAMAGEGCTCTLVRGATFDEGADALGQAHA